MKIAIYLLTFLCSMAAFGQGQINTQVLPINRIDLLVW